MSSLSDPRQASRSDRVSAVAARTQSTLEQPHRHEPFHGEYQRYASKKARTLHIFVVDNEEIYFRGLSVALATHPQIKLLGPVRNGRDVLDHMGEPEPNVAIVSTTIAWQAGDATLASANRLIPALLSKFPRLIILPLYRIGEESLVANMVALGAHGKIARNISESRLRDIFLSYCEEALPASSQQMRNAAPRQQTPRAHYGLLTERQHQVLLLLAQGLTDAEVANRLKMSVGTARKHTENIRARLNVSSRTAAVVKASAMGLL